MNKISKMKYDEALTKLEEIMSVLGPSPYSEEDTELWELEDYYQSIIETYRNSNNPPADQREHLLNAHSDEGGVEPGM